MKDPIERQDAIDALRYAQHRFTVADEAGGMGTVKWSEDVIYFSAAEKVLANLPSAHPEQSSEIQDILEYLDTVLHPIISPDHWSVYSELHDMISMLPSAQPEQPEIIRCKDCKQFRRWIDTNTCFCDITESEISDNDFCSRAERRTDGRSNKPQGGD